MQTGNKNIPQKTPPLDFPYENDVVQISLKNKSLVMLIKLYSEDKHALFWVLSNIKYKIQNDEAAYLTDKVIRKAQNAK